MEGKLMANTKYTYSISGDFLNGKVGSTKLTQEIGSSTIVYALDHISTIGDVCDIWFKSVLSGGEETTLDGVVAAHDGTTVDTDAPTMSDGRPLVRADTRPLSHQTYFTCAGDTASGIGDGKHLQWDFTNDDDIIESSPYCDIPDGYKTKEIKLQFIDPIYLKDGSLYFFDAPWGAHCDMHIVIPAGNYYPNPTGAIPAAALGQPGDDMYSYAAQDTVYVTYVNKHHMYGSCPMGDELNAEGAAVDALPVGWLLVGHITTVSGDNTSKGFASFECYRARTVLLEGDTP
jgi:hypothetical protein